MIEGMGGPDRLCSNIINFMSMLKGSFDFLPQLYTSLSTSIFYYHGLSITLTPAK